MRPSLLVYYFLSADRNPLCWFPKQYCSAHECKLLAAFVFAHTPKSGLPAMLIESSDQMKYGLDLVHVLLKPCTMRYSSAEDPTTNDLLRDLLRKMKDQHVSGYLEPGLLRHVLERTPKKKRLERLEILVSFGRVSETECREALTRLSNEPDDTLQLSLAEPLLVPLLDPTHDMPRLYDNSTSYLSNQSSSQIQRSSENQRARETLKECILPQCGVSPCNESENHIVRSVVHVYTKHMLEGNVSRHDTSADRIIFIASHLRQVFGLPDVPVAKDLLLALHYKTLMPRQLCVDLLLCNHTRGSLDL